MTEDEHPLIRGLRWILANRKQPNGRRMSMRALSVAAGLSPSHVEQIINLRQSPKGVGLATLQALAAAAQVRLEWLQTGDGDPEALEATPPTPPAKSGLRLSSGEERDDVEYVDAWFFEALQELQGRRRYSGAQGQAAKRFLVWGSNKLDGDPKKMVLGALEAAKELDETGQQMTPEKIFALLVEKNAPPSGPQSGAREHDAALEFTKEFIRKESKKALKGFSPKERKSRER